MIVWIVCEDTVIAIIDGLQMDNHMELVRVTCLIAHAHLLPAKHRVSRVR